MKTSRHREINNTMSNVTPGKNTRVGSHFFSRNYTIKVLFTQSHPTICNPMDCSLPGSSVHEILQARILEWVTVPFSRGSSWPKVEPWSPTLLEDSLLSEPQLPFSIHSMSRGTVWHRQNLNPGQTDSRSHCTGGHWALLDTTSFLWSINV